MNFTDCDSDIDDNYADEESNSSEGNKVEEESDVEEEEEEEEIDGWWQTSTTTKNFHRQLSKLTRKRKRTDDSDDDNDNNTEEERPPNKRRHTLPLVPLRKPPIVGSKVYIHYTTDCTCDLKRQGKSLRECLCSSWFTGTVLCIEESNNNELIMYVVQFLDEAASIKWWKQKNDEKDNDWWAVKE